MFSQEDEDSNWSTSSATQDGRPKRQKQDIAKTFCLVYFLEDDYCAIDVATKFFNDAKCVDDLKVDIQTTIEIFWPEDQNNYDGRLLAISRNRIDLVELEEEFKKRGTIESVKVVIPGLRGLPGHGREWEDSNDTVEINRLAASSRKRKATKPSHGTAVSDPNNILEMLSLPRGDIPQQGRPVAHLASSTVPAVVRSAVPAAFRSAVPATVRSAAPAVVRSAAPAAVRSAGPAAVRSAAPAAVRIAAPAAVRIAAPAAVRSAAPAAVRSAAPSTVRSAGPATFHNAGTAPVRNSCPAADPNHVEQNSMIRRTKNGLPFKKIPEQLLTEIFLGSSCYIDKQFKATKTSSAIKDQKELLDLGEDQKKIDDVANKLARSLLWEFFDQDIFLYTAQGYGNNEAAPEEVLRAIEAYVSEKLGPLTKSMARIFSDLKRDKNTSNARRKKEGRFAPGHKPAAKKNKNGTNDASVNNRTRQGQPLTEENQQQPGCSRDNEDRQNRPPPVNMGNLAVGSESSGTSSVPPRATVQDREQFSAPCHRRRSDENQVTANLQVYPTTTARGVESRGSRPFPTSINRNINPTPSIGSLGPPSAFSQYQQSSDAGHQWTAASFETLGATSSSHGQFSHGLHAASALQALSATYDDSASWVTDV